MRWQDHGACRDQLRFVVSGLQGFNCAWSRHFNHERRSHDSELNVYKTISAYVLEGTDEAADCAWGQLPGNRLDGHRQRGRAADWQRSPGRECLHLVRELAGAAWRYGVQCGHAARQQVWRCHSHGHSRRWRAIVLRKSKQRSEIWVGYWGCWER